MGAWTGRRLHFVGIAGAGLSAYALAAKALGAEVTGSDRAESPYLARVREAGIVLAIGHAAENLPEDDDVELVVSTAIPRENPEIAAASARGLTVMPRAAFLRQLTQLRRTIAVAGAHGKTTTSSMIAHALLECGFDPGYLIGGTLSTTATNGAWGSGEWLVVEADESDRSFLELDVDVAVVTNVELDHHAEYGSRLELDGVYRAFLAGAPVAVLPGDDEEVRALRGEEGGSAEGAGSRTLFFSAAEAPELAVPGEHNRRNSAAALAACVVAGADRERAAAALGTFRGAGRRFEELGRTASGAIVVDDYAHHPTEVAATIAAARERGPQRVVAVFQPHLYSRTQHLHREFGAALATADVPAALEIYPARERGEDFPGVTGLLIAEAAADAGGGKPVLWLRDFDHAERILRAELREGDLLLVLGAGDVDGLGRSLVA